MRITSGSTHSKEGTEIGLSALYGRAITAKRTGALFGAFPYPTKISPETIALYIASHTHPGATVFDGFAGTGTTGLAALLCENPPKELREEAGRLGLQVEWGARNAVLYELGALGSFVGRTLTAPPNPTAFRKAAEKILLAIERELGWMYETSDPTGERGEIRHAVWSDILKCPACRCQVTMWDSRVQFNPARINSVFDCPQCNHKASFRGIERITNSIKDDVESIAIEHRVWKLARVYGVTGTTRWSRPPTNADISLLDRIAQQPLPSSVPNVRIPWGDLYRRGYHQGITHLHHFYTRRNLIIFSRLWELANESERDLLDALRFWLLSYNAAHATVMTRVVAKTNQKDLAVTGAQPGVLYISGLPVEKNLFAGLRRKLRTVTDAFTAIHRCAGEVNVYQKSSCAVDLPDGSIDYAFTDPPFGGNIPYSEINFINEAWLGRYTDQSDEIIVSDSQQKTIVRYEKLLTTALSEVHRILKPNGHATLVFHSASAKIWNALRDACSNAGFNVEHAGVLSKTQGSFKQVTTAGAVRGDPVLLLGKALVSENKDLDCVWTVAEELCRAALLLDPSERTPQRLYSRLVGILMTNHQKVQIDADEFYRWHETQQAAKDSCVARS